MKICHNMNIMVQTKVGNEYSLNRNRVIPNKTMANTTRELILNSGNKEELWCFALKYTIWFSRRALNSLHSDVTYLLWNGLIQLYKRIKTWGVRVYIMHGSVTINKLEYRSHRGDLLRYVATTWVILYWKSYQPYAIYRAHQAWLDKHNSCLSTE